MTFATKSTTKKKAPRKATFVDAILIVLLVLFTVGSTIFIKKVYNAFGTNLIFFRTQLTNCLYNIYATVIVVFKLCTKGRAGLRHSLKWYHFVFLAFCDSSSDLLRSIGGVNTSGTAQTLLGQLVIPATMACTIAIFRRMPYKKWHYLAVTIILAGVCLGVLIDPHHVGTMMKKITANNANVWYMVLVYALSSLPQATSSVFKQKYLQQKKGAIDMFLLTCLVSWIQLLWTWSFSPILQIKKFGGIQFNQIGGVMKNGLLCFLGDSAIKVFNQGKYVGTCSPHVPLITMIYSACGFSSGIIALIISKRLSANVAVIAAACSLPIANVAFSIRFIMGDEATELNPYDLVGVFLVVCGFLMYNLVPEKTQDAQDAQETDPLLAADQDNFFDDDDDDASKTIQ